MPEVIQIPEKWFYTRDGRTLNSLTQLIEEYKNNLDNPSEEFIFHLSNNGNDYANWVKGVFNLDELADLIRNTKDAKVIVEALEKYLESEETKKEKKQTEEPKPDAKKVETKIQEKQEEKAEEKTVEKSEEKPKGKIIEANSPEEQEVKKHLEKFTKTSEELLEKANKMKEASLLKFKSDNYVDEAQEAYNEIYAEVSEARKEGVDVFIPELKLKNIKPKIIYLKVSKKKEDLDLIIKLVKDIKAELKDAKEYEAPDLKKEILEAANKEIAIMNKEKEE